MTFDWYPIFNLPKFLADGFVSKKITVLLDGRGQADFLVYCGNEVSIQYKDTLLPVDFLTNNPYENNGYGIYRDNDDNVWFGFQVDE